MAKHSKLKLEEKSRVSNSEPNKLQDEQAIWHNYAQVYDELLKIIPYRNLLVDIVVRADIDNGMKIFDAGCGTGNFLWALEHKNIQANVTGLDYSPTMLQKARAKIAQYSGSAMFLEANLDNPAKTWKVTSQYDRIIFNNNLCVIADPAQTLHEVATIAAPGAILVASTPRPNPSIDEVLDEHLQQSAYFGQSREEAMQHIAPVLQPLIECNAALFKHYGSTYHLPSQPELLEWFKGAGWKILEVETVYAGQNWLVTAVKDTSA
jgi:ubiquinone/menaquinone biosynthesis C-methylase UbiE